MITYVGTCENCNRALQSYRRKVIVTGDRQYAERCMERYDPGLDPQLKQIHAGRRGTRHLIPPEWEITYRGGRGYKGDGTFCSQRCGYEWAIAFRAKRIMR